MFYLKNPRSTFDQVMFEVLSRKGDTDTNAAIVGACIGGVYGFSGLN